MGYFEFPAFLPILSKNSREKHSGTNFFFAKLGKRASPDFPRALRNPAFVTCIGPILAVKMCNRIKSTTPERSRRLPGLGKVFFSKVICETVSSISILEGNREVLKIIHVLYLTDFALSHHSTSLQPGNCLLP